MTFWRVLSESGGTAELNGVISNILRGIGVEWDESHHSLVALYGMVDDFVQASGDRMIIAMNDAIQDIYNEESAVSSVNFTPGARPRAEWGEPRPGYVPRARPTHVERNKTFHWKLIVALTLILPLLFNKLPAES